MSDAVICRLTRTHLSDVAALERLCFGEPWSERALELLLTDWALGIVAERDGRAVAYVGMLIALDEGQITNVAVHPDLRRAGLGAAVVEAMVVEARRLGLTQISLEVRASNQAAIALYRRFGFFEAGRRKGFYRDPREDALVMILEMQNLAASEHLSNQ